MSKFQVAVVNPMLSGPAQEQFGHKAVPTYSASSAPTRQRRPSVEYTNQILYSVRERAKAGTETCFYPW
jgi:hypothetical protein